MLIQRRDSGCFFILLLMESRCFYEHLHPHISRRGKCPAWGDPEQWDFASFLYEQDVCQDEKRGVWRSRSSSVGRNEPLWVNLPDGDILHSPKRHWIKSCRGFLNPLPSNHFVFGQLLRNPSRGRAEAWTSCCDIKTEIEIEGQACVIG